MHYRNGREAKNGDKVVQLDFDSANFSYADLAALLGVSERTVRRMHKSGAIDPRDLASVCAAWAQRTRRCTRA